MRLHTQIRIGGELRITNTQRAYLEKNIGKRAFIIIDERSNLEKISFIEGAIVKYYFYQHNIGVFRNFRDARYSLKKLFNLGWYINAEGKQDEVIESMSKIYANKSKTQKFIDSCQRYFMENGYEFPDSENYKQWVDSAPLAREVYPPLKRLIDAYNEL